MTPDLVGCKRMNANICDVRDDEFDVVLRDDKGIARMSVTVLRCEGHDVKRNEEYSVLLCVEANVAPVNSQP